MELQEYYHKVMLPDIRRKIVELKKEMGAWGKQQRILYLMERREEYEMRLIDLESEYQKQKDKDTPYVERGILTNSILKTRKNIEKIERECGSIVNRNGKTTDDDIAKVKEYPIESLLEFKKGKAICIFHNDKHPSISVKNNRYRCWSCGAKGDSISLVMELQKLGFLDSVKYLMGR